MLSQLAIRLADNTQILGVVFLLSPVTMSTHCHDKKELIELHVPACEREVGHHELLDLHFLFQLSLLLEAISEGGQDQLHLGWLCIVAHETHSPHLTGSTTQAS